jgi:translation initiation factor IF-3
MERFSRVMPSREPGVRMNENIRVPEIRVLDDNGQLGVMSPKEALDIARSRGLDLIEIVPNAQPPVCKIIDFGKWKYEQQKRDKQAKKSQHQQLLKEVRFHPNTDTHDFEFKVRHARGFIEEGHKVKAYVQFKGREVAYKQFGEELLNSFKARLEDIAKIDQDISMMGRTMSMVLSPSGKKKPVAPKKPSEDGAGTGKPERRVAPAEDGEKSAEPADLEDSMESLDSMEPQDSMESQDSMEPLDSMDSQDSTESDESTEVSEVHNAGGTEQDSEAA